MSYDIGNNFDDDNKVTDNDFNDNDIKLKGQKDHEEEANEVESHKYFSVKNEENKENYTSTSMQANIEFDAYEEGNLSLL